MITYSIFAVKVSPNFHMLLILENAFSSMNNVWKIKNPKPSEEREWVKINFEEIMIKICLHP